MTSIKSLSISVVLVARGAWHAAVTGLRDHVGAVGAQVAVDFGGLTQQLEVSSLHLFDNVLGLSLPSSCPADTGRQVSLASGAGMPSMIVCIAWQHRNHACLTMAACGSFIPRAAHLAWTTGAVEQADHACEITSLHGAQMHCPALTLRQDMGMQCSVEVTDLTLVGSSDNPGCQTDKCTANADASIGLVPALSSPIGCAAR